MLNLKKLILISLILCGFWVCTIYTSQAYCAICLRSINLFSIQKLLNIIYSQSLISSKVCTVNSFFLLKHPLSFYSFINIKIIEFNWRIPKHLPHSVIRVILRLFPFRTILLKNRFPYLIDIVKIQISCIICKVKSIG